MVRNRDFILYISVLLFVIMGAVYTGISGRAQNVIHVVLNQDSGSEEIDYTAESSPSFDRAERITTLRAKLAEGVDTRSDEVAVSVPDIQIEETSTTSNASMRTEKYCSVNRDPQLGGSWPSNVSLTESEGLHVVSATLVTPSFGTTSASDREVELFTIPVRQISAGYSTCLPDDLVGITKNGQPLYNSAAPYVASAESTLIGYARDGLPIFGVKHDSSMLDDCGGVFENGQYRYYIRKEDNFILACYAAVPAPIRIPVL